jgi:hypothetical protein
MYTSSVVAHKLAHDKYLREFLNRYGILCLHIQDSSESKLPIAMLRRILPVTS